MKKLIKIITILFITVFAISCSKEEEAAKPAETIIDLAIENNTLLDIPVAPAGLYSYANSNIDVTKTANLINSSKLVLELNLENNIQSRISCQLISPDGKKSTFIYKPGVFYTSGDYKGFIGTNKLKFCSAFTNLLPNNNVDFPAGDYKGGLGTNFDIGFLENPIFKKFENNPATGTWRLSVLNYDQTNQARLISWRLIFEAGSLN